MAAPAAAEAKRRNATGMGIASSIVMKMNETRCHLSLPGRGDVTAIEKF
jgi:hypothetical protein